MNYQALQEAIATAIKTNGEGEITGAVLQSVLQSMVSIVGANYQFMGVATTNTNPGTPAGSVFYLTSTAGTYTNFNNIEVEDGKLVALMWDSTAWTKSEICDLSSGTTEVISPMVGKGVEGKYIYTGHNLSGSTICSTLLFDVTNIASLNVDMTITSVHNSYASLPWEVSTKTVTEILANINVVASSIIQQSSDTIPAGQGYQNSETITFTTGAKTLLVTTNYIIGADGDEVLANGAVKVGNLVPITTYIEEELDRLDGRKLYNYIDFNLDKLSPWLPLTQTSAFFPDGNPFEYRNGIKPDFANKIQTGTDFLSVGANKFVRFNLSQSQAGDNSGYCSLAMIFAYSARQLLKSQDRVRVIFDCKISAGTAQTVKLEAWASMTPSGTSKPSANVTLQPSIINHVDVILPTFTSALVTWDITYLTQIKLYISKSSSNNFNIDIANLIITDELGNGKVNPQLPYVSNEYRNKKIIYIGDSISSSSWDYWCLYLNNYYSLIHNCRSTNSTPDTEKPAIPIASVCCDADGMSLNANHSPYSIWYKCANHRMDVWDFDIISLYGGTNDDYINKVNGLGTTSDKPYVDDASTFATPANYVDTWSSSLTFAQFYMGCIEMLQRDFPTKEIILCTLLPGTTQLDTDPNTNMSTGETMSAFIVRVAKKYGLKVVPWYWSIYNENVYTINSFTNEGTHPIKTTAYMMAQRFAEVLRLPVVK